MADKPVGRPMKFPYTFSAKLAQFPFKFYVQKQWIWKYYAVAFGLCIPVFYKISSLGKFFFSLLDNEDNITSNLLEKLNCFFLTANNPENKAKWAEIRRLEREGHH